jgi:hypothetical protein
MTFYFLVFWAHAMNQKHFLTALLCCLFCAAFWQGYLTVVLAQSGRQLLTPDPQINRQIQGTDIAGIDFLGFKPEAKGLLVVPTLQPGWTWLAAKHVPYENRTISFFLHDGYLTPMPI